MANSPKVDRLFIDAERWRQEVDELRGILLECGLVEEQKWGKPCYADNGKNICIIQRFKDFLALLFFKGALLKDPDGMLERQGPNSRVGYRVRFTSAQDVRRMAKSIKAYVHEAIEVEKAGREVEQREAAEIEYSEELIDTFGNDPDFKAAFERLTPGRQRGYIWHFAHAKQSKTRAARIEKNRRKIFDGKGLRDR